MGQGVDWAALKAAKWERAGRVLAMVLAGAVTYFAMLALLGFRLRDFRRREPALPPPTP
jgi:putative peptidoglycan lipid II flippase